MKLVAPLDRRWHRPFEIVDGPSETGPRLGGRAPAIDVRLAKVAFYVLTFPFAEDPPLEASVFVNCTFDTLLEAMNQGIKSDDRVVITVHSPVPRLGSREFASDLTEHAIAVGDRQRDEAAVIDGRIEPASSHKLGGRPYCIQEPVLDGAEALLDRGYVHALQLDYPVRSNVSGNWPFADGLFNVFLHPHGRAKPRWAFQK